MASAVKRTPSPQQFFESASKQVTAGMAAAGAALGSIMEGSDEEFDERGNRRRDRSSKRDRRGEEGFSDHERWSEEADERQRVTASAVEAESERRADNARSLRDDKGKRNAKKAVAVVVSADTNSSDIGYNNDSSAEFTTEHAVSPPYLLNEACPANKPSPSSPTSRQLTTPTPPTSSS